MKRDRGGRGIVKKELQEKESSAAGKISIVPNDVLFEILLRLSASSVIRLRRVCKSWHSLTTDPSFVRRHTRRQYDKSMLVQYDPLEAPSPNLTMHLLNAHVNNDGTLSRNFQIPVKPEYAIDGRPDYSYTLSAQLSCDGLLCFTSARGPNPYYICNPTTKTWTSVSESLHGRFHTDLRGFYFHRSTGEYRLLQFFTKGKSTTTGPVEVGYEVSALNGGEDKSWRTVYKRRYPTTSALGRAGKLDRLLAEDSSSMVWGPQFVVNENLHWLPCPHRGDKVIVHDRWNDVGILVFDTSSEEFRSISFPFKITEQNRVRATLLFEIGSFPFKITEQNRVRATLLFEIGGNLCIECKIGCNHFELWLLKDYHNLKWVEMPSIMSSLENAGSRPGKKGEEDNEGGNMFIRRNHFIFSFSLDDLKRNIWRITQIQRVSPSCNSVGYTESLVTI